MVGDGRGGQRLASPDACLCEILWFDPLVLTLDGSPVHLTDAAGGVGFDLTGDGLGERVACDSTCTAAWGRRERRQPWCRPGRNK